MMDKQAEELRQYAEAVSELYDLCIAFSPIKPWSHSGWSDEPEACDGALHRLPNLLAIVGYLQPAPEQWKAGGWPPWSGIDGVHLTSATIKDCTIEPVLVVDRAWYAGAEAVLARLDLELDRSDVHSMIDEGQDGELTVGQLALVKNQLKCLGITVERRPKPIAVMRAIMRAHPKPVSRDEIIAAVWPVETNTDTEKALHTHISALRSSLKTLLGSASGMREHVIAGEGEKSSLSYHIDCDLLNSLCETLGETRPDLSND